MGIYLYTKQYDANKMLQSMNSVFRSILNRATLHAVSAGEYPIHLAVYSGSTNTVRVSLEGDPSLARQKDSQGDTAADLSAYCKTGSIAMLQLIEEFDPTAGACFEIDD